MVLLSTEKILLRDAIANDIEELTGLMTDLGYPATVAEMSIRFKSIFPHPDYKTIVAVINNVSSG